ncbi:hypothetical protein FOCG_14479 [Fusarium oxysporum f. sp. radicis-lycopersici 26381]|nr:hypothetical protein FOCG_14479 [Fusarium oxysporum f. sp. radicis-lycopersici 26381]
MEKGSATNYWRRLDGLALTRQGADRSSRPTVAGFIHLVDEGIVKFQGQVLKVPIVRSTGGLVGIGKATERLAQTDSLGVIASV